MSPSSAARLFLASLLILSLALAAPARALTLNGRVTRVIDGDTVDLLVEGGRQARVRLSGVDAPERGQAFGNRARQELSRLVAGREVRVESRKNDRYGRVVGTIYRERTDVCAELIGAGLAWYYRHYASDLSADQRDRYDQLEAEARAARRGLWSDRRPIPPWEWRRGAR